MEGLCRSRREAPPAHFKLKIESFSQLASSSLNKFESCEFAAGDYKWKLSLHPNGNKERGGEDHLSLYLVLASKRSVSNLNKVILASFSLFLFDNIRDKYLFVHDVSRFHAMKLQAGFDKFLPLEVFSEASNGYLVGDSCMIGAEVFYIESTMKGQCLSMIKDPVPFTYTWKIEKFSELKDECHESEAFTTAGHDFKVLLYPKGHLEGKGKFLSLYLGLAYPEKLLPDSEVLVQYTLRLVSQSNKKHRELRSEMDCLSALVDDWGWLDFLRLSDLNGSAGYLVKDTCILEAEVIIRGSAKNWD